MAEFNTLGASQTNSLEATGPQSPRPPAPEGPKYNPVALLDLHERLKKESFQDRWVWEREWLRDIFYTANRQWIYWHPTRREWVDKRLNKNVPRPVTNKVAEVVQSLRASFGAIELGIVARPIGHNPESVATAEITDKISPLLHSEHKMTSVMREADFWLIVCGNAALQISWDQDKRFNRIFIPSEQCLTCGQILHPNDIVKNNNTCPSCGGNQFGPALREDGQAEGEWQSYGRGKTTALSPFEYALPPNITRFEDAPYVYRLRWRDKSFYEANYPHLMNQLVWENTPQDRSLQIYKALALINDVGTGTQFSSLSAGGSPSLEGITEYELWLKPTEQFPEGFVMRIAGDRSPVILEMEDEGIPGPLPYKDRDGMPIFPFSHAQFEHIGGRLYGRSAISPIIQKQDQLNQLDSLIQMIVQRVANPVWIIPESAGIDHFTGDPGLVMKWNSLAAGGNAKPERIAGENVPPTLFQLRAQYIQDIEELCLTGDTPIPCLDGQDRTMKELSEQFPNGGMWVYGFDTDTMRIVPSEIKKAWKTGHKPIYKVTFQEGTHIRCTANHKFLTYDRGYVAAEDLRVDEAIVPCVVKDAQQKGSKRYQHVIQPVDRKSEPVHRMVAYALHDLKRGQSHLDVHHIDCNGLNNLPGNLQVLTRAEHVKIEPRHSLPRLSGAAYSAFSKKRWEGSTKKERQIATAPMLSAQREYWDNLSLDERSERAKAVWAKASSELRAAHGAKISATKQAVRLNHRVASVEYDGEADVFDLTTTTANFGTCAEIFVHNSGTFDILKGAKPAGVEAFSALQLLVERSQARFTSAFAARGEMYRAWFSAALELERQFGPQERIRAITSPNKGFTFQQFENAQLQGNVSIHVEDGTNVPKTPLGKRAAIEHANQLQLLDPNDPDQKYAILSQLGLADLVPSLDVHVQTALQIQDAFERWVERPAGPSPLVIKPWHDPHIHWGERVKWLNGDTMRELIQRIPQVEMIVSMHLQQIQMILAPPPEADPEGGPPQEDPEGGVGAGRAMKNSNNLSGSPTIGPG